MKITTRTLFAIPHWQFKVKDFEIKRKALLNAFKPFDEKQNDSEFADFTTNRYSTADIINTFSKIMNDELLIISKTIENDIAVKEVWSVSYKTGGYHPVHNHGSTGLSAILYLNLPEDSPSTSFLQPWNNVLTDKSIYATPNVVEGEIVVVPSFIQHFTQPNKSKKIKKTVSWDIDVITNNEIF